MRNRMFKLADQSSHEKHRHAAWLRPHAEMFQDYSVPACSKPLLI